MTSTLPSPEPPHLRHLPIAFERNLKHEARSNQEDWSGLASSAERRKIQNRLNARAYRKRKTLQKQIFQSQSASSSPATPQSIQTPKDTENSGSLTSEAGREDLKQSVIVNRKAPPRLCMGEVNATEFLRRVEARYAAYQRLVPNADNLLTLIYYNVFRAFMTNVGLLHLDPALLCDDNYPSPFYQAGSGGPRPQLLPPSLRPTHVQKTIPHHPMIDLFPSAKLREQLILGEGLYEDEELALDLMGEMTQVAEDMMMESGAVPESERIRCELKSSGGSGSSSSSSEYPQGCGMIVWGEPYLTESWEMSEPFFRKWFWLFNECTDVIESSNRWRAQRGEAPLPSRFEEVA